MQHPSTRQVVLLAGLLALFLVGSVSSASASLIFVTDIEVSGTGLGAVNTLVTVHDPGGPGNDNGIESGCINQDGSFSPCLGAVEGGDNTAINQLLTFTNNTSYAAVVNISETGGDQSVILTNLYLTFCDTGDPMDCHTAFYTGDPIQLTQGTGTGLGQSGFTFRLDDGQAAIVAALGPAVIVSGGVQFGEGTTDDGNETVHVLRIQGNRVVPEPASLLLMGTGFLALARHRLRRRQ